MKITDEKISQMSDLFMTLENFPRGLTDKDIKYVDFPMRIISELCRVSDSSVGKYYNEWKEKSQTV